MRRTIWFLGPFPILQFHPFFSSRVHVGAKISLINFTTIMLLYWIQPMWIIEWKDENYWMKRASREGIKVEFDGWIVRIVWITRKGWAGADIGLNLSKTKSQKVFSEKNHDGSQWNFEEKSWLLLSSCQVEPEVLIMT